MIALALPLIPLLLLLLPTSTPYKLPHARLYPSFSHSSSRALSQKISQPLSIKRRNALLSLSTLPLVLLSSTPSYSTSTPTPTTYTDEFDITYTPTPSSPALGIRLSDVTYSTAVRVSISAVYPNSPLWSQQDFKDYMKKYKPMYDSSNPNDRDIGLTVVSINGRPTERTNADGVRFIINDEIKKGSESVVLRVRGSGIFNDRLTGGTLREGEKVETTVAPKEQVDGKGNGGYDEEKITKVAITKLREGNGRRSAVDGDLIEISYNAYYLPRGVADGGEGGGRVLFDSSSSRGSESGTVSFVLNRQPFGQFPTAFNLGCEGIRTGEIRRIVVPKEIGMEENGRKRAKIPEGVEGYVYEIKGVLINAMT